MNYATRILAAFAALIVFTAPVSAQAENLKVSPGEYTVSLTAGDVLQQPLTLKYTGEGTVGAEVETVIDAESGGSTEGISAEMEQSSYTLSEGESVETFVEISTSSALKPDSFGIESRPVLVTVSRSYDDSGGNYYPDNPGEDDSSSEFEDLELVEGLDSIVEDGEVNESEVKRINDIFVNASERFSDLRERNQELEREREEVEENVSELRTENNRLEERVEELENQTGNRTGNPDRLPMPKDVRDAVEMIGSRTITFFTSPLHFFSSLLS